MINTAPLTPAIKPFLTQTHRDWQVIPFRIFLFLCIVLFSNGLAFSSNSIVAVVAPSTAGSAQIREYSITGSLLQTITVPSCTLVNGPDSSMTPDGFVSLSPDSSTACFQCYNGAASKAVLFKYDGTVDATTSTTLLVPLTSKGGCATDGDGTNVWMFGGGSASTSSAVVYLTKGSSTGLPLVLKSDLSNGNTRFGAIYDATLYLYSYTIGLYAINDGTSEGLPINSLPGVALLTMAPSTLTGDLFYFYNSTRIISGVHSGNGCKISYVDFIGCNWMITFSKTISGSSYGTYWACYTIAGQYESGTYFIYAMSPNTIIKINTQTWTSASFKVDTTNAFKGIIIAPTSVPSASPTPYTGKLLCSKSPLPSPTSSVVPALSLDSSITPLVSPTASASILISPSPSNSVTESYSKMASSTEIPTTTIISTLSAFATQLICTAGYYYPSGYSSSTCVLCPAGSFCVGQTFSLPATCTAGTFSSLGASACTPCPPKTSSLAGSSACASTVLWSTGVDSSNVPLGSGSSDPHYNYAACGGTAASCAGVALTPAVVTSNCAVGAWYQPPWNSWLGSCTLSNGQWFIYSTTVFVADPTVASIGGSYACDNSCEVALNGVSVSSLSLPQSFLSLHPFSMPVGSGFSAGINTISFYVFNGLYAGQSQPNSGPGGYFGVFTSATGMLLSGVCDAGSYKTGTSCTPCPVGSYCPAASTAPILCPAGSYCPFGSLNPTLCPASTWSAAVGAISNATCNYCGGTSGNLICNGDFESGTAWFSTPLLLQNPFVSGNAYYVGSSMSWPPWGCPAMEIIQLVSVIILPLHRTLGQSLYGYMQLQYMFRLGIATHSRLIIVL